MNILKASIGASLSLVAVACATDFDQEVATGVVEEAATSRRGDYIDDFRPGEGHWGNWSQTLFCNRGTWATGYRMRVEPHQGAGRTPDDTALNAVELLCASPDGARTDRVLAHPGIWGDWHEPAHCGADGFLSGARMRIEGPRGGGEDDTSANDIQFACSNGGTAEAPGGGGFGEWNDWQFCAEGSVVCGISVRFEEAQGGSSRNDDTALNGVKLMCCEL